MSVETVYSENENTLTIRIKGVFNFSIMNEFRQSYSNSISKTTKIIVDLRENTMLDSSALGMLLAMKEFLKREDGDINIINCNPVVMKIFEITHFEKMFNFP